MRPEPDEVDAKNEADIELKQGAVHQRVALLGQAGKQVRSEHHNAKQQHAFVHEARQTPAQAWRECPNRGGGGRRRVSHGWRIGSEAELERTAAPCGPRFGKSVALSTNPGLAAILGRPGCWWAGGEASLATLVVVAPGCACTAVELMGVGRAEKAGFGTIFDLPCVGPVLPSARAAARGPGWRPGPDGAGPAARSTSLRFCSGARASYASHCAGRSCGATRLAASNCWRVTPRSAGLSLAQSAIRSCTRDCSCGSIEGYFSAMTSHFRLRSVSMDCHSRSRGLSAWRCAGFKSCQRGLASETGLALVCGRPEGCP